MTDADLTYRGGGFSVHVSQTAVLHTLHLDSDGRQLVLNKTGNKNARLQNIC